MANYEATRGLAPINQTGSSGVLTSPNYPNDYGNFVEQYYYVYGPAGFRVRINVDDFYTEDNRDYLDIFNSTEVFDNSTLVARLTGYYVAPWNYTFPSNTFGMRFMSDWLVDYR
ncbi:hypothetical protein WR25_11753 [Diploscapter pachys]|uniref:CUB domain-containing protein n=1 Tax=Diploscapter pachys TaxID=2018661 RepID=A0A2A2JXB6_9BILA|nr:hypothetical protein WR25_11753 [Diploscapter pachys]